MVRKLIWGSDWKKVRVGLLLRINGTASITTGNQFAIGLCNNPPGGTTGSVPNAPNCPLISSFMGLTKTSASDVFTYATDSNGSYFELVNPSFSDFSAAFTPLGTQLGSLRVTAQAGKCTPLFLEFDRTGPGVFVEARCHVRGKPESVSKQQLVEWMTTGYDAEFTGSGGTGGGFVQPITGSVLDGGVFGAPVNPPHAIAGNLDSLCIYWPFPASYLEVYAVVVARIY
jgi:hypothetical protein